MVESLLSFGRMEAGAYAWRLEPVDPDQLMRSLVEEFRGDALATGHRLVADIDDGLPEIRADREALSRALWNLIENAAKYSGASPSPRRRSSLKAAMNTELVDGNLRAAIGQYKKVAQSGNRPLAAQALLRMAECYQKLGEAESRKVYELVVRVLP